MNYLTNKVTRDYETRDARQDPEFEVPEATRRVEWPASRSPVSRVKMFCYNESCHE